MTTETKTRHTPGPWVGRDNYSDDRLSLAKELRETLWNRGAWCPNTAGPDLILAMSQALDERKELLEACKFALENPSNFDFDNRHVILTNAIAKAEGR